MAPAATRDHANTAIHYGNECISLPLTFYNLPRIVDLVAGERPFQNWSPHVSKHWQRRGKCGIRGRTQEGAEDTIHIDYDGEYGSERVLIVSGCAEQRGAEHKDFS